MAGATKDDKYLLESNVDETQRLQDQHAVITATLGTLTLAPLNTSRPLRVLDSGTADGHYLRELASHLRAVNPTVAAQHSYVGTDIVAAYFPERNSLENNTHYAIQSITQPWPTTWKHEEAFDYVHQRMVLAGAAEKPLRGVVSALLELVKPGGWVELIEANLFSDHGNSNNGPYARLFGKLLGAMLDATGVGANYAAPLADWVHDTGFEHVESRSFETGFGAACKDPALREQSARSVASAARGLVQVSRLMPLGIAEEELQDFSENLEQEVLQRGMVTWTLGVWGQRPG